MAMTRGKMIREKRIRLGLSQEEVAGAARIYQQSYSDIEGDRTTSPRRAILKAISKMLDIPFESLLLGDDWREPIPESARVVAREYPSLRPENQNRILSIILEDKQQKEEESKDAAPATDSA